MTRISQAVWKAAHRQLSAQSARQLAQGHVGINQVDLDAIVSPAAPSHGVPSAAKPPTLKMSEGVTGAESNQRVRYSELVAKILSGTATEAEQNEAELIGTGHLLTIIAQL